MKKVIFFITLICFFLSCNNNDDSNSVSEDSNLIGSWKLTQNLADPGDGSGEFSSVVSDKIITFNSNGTITSNGSLCDLSIQTETPTSGTYSIDQLIINSNDCTNTGLNIRFALDDSTLTISYPCFEPCQSKYIKIEE